MYGLVKRFIPMKNPTTNGLKCVILYPPGKYIKLTIVYKRIIRICIYTVNLDMYA